jgi:hypothetical protein
VNERNFRRKHRSTDIGNEVVYLGQQFTVELGYVSQIFGADNVQEDVIKRICNQISKIRFRHFCREPARIMHLGIFKQYYATQALPIVSHYPSTSLYLNSYQSVR